MAIEALKPIKTAVTRALSSNKSQKVAEATVKDGERMLANGQDAAAIQGRAMVKPFEKPSMEKANLKSQNTKAASGKDKFGGDDLIDDGGGIYNAPSYSSRSDFERELNGLFDDMGM